MAYIDFLDNLLKPKIIENEIVIDLFAGCGGLSLGFEALGYETLGFEMNEDAAKTYNNNLSGICYNTKLEIGFEYPNADIVIGGPPCQPFSVGGHQKGINDARNGFPIFIDAVKRIKPRVFMFENVRGLLYSNKWYFDLLIEELNSLGYLIEFKLINAVNYGVPQNRERLFVIGHKSTFTFPTKQTKKITVQNAIGDLMYETSNESKFVTIAQDEYIAKYERASKCINPRDLDPNKPSRTLTCRNLAAATGDMHRIKLHDGRRKRISTREAARLQSFPDWFEFSGNETSQFYQIGNAVAPFLAYQMADSIQHTFNLPTLSEKQILKIKLSESKVQEQ